MSRSVMRQPYLLIPLVLAVLAGCQDTTAPLAGPKPQFAQGDGGVWTVNSLDDPGDGSCDEVECTLREAIAAAASGDNIVFESGLEGTINLTAGQLLIEAKALIIDGDGRIAIDAHGNSRVLSVDGSLGPTTSASLARLTLTNGAASSGGGILVFVGSLILDEVTFE